MKLPSVPWKNIAAIGGAVETRLWLATRPGKHMLNHLSAA
ncbi:hypothetical protein HDC96_000554 [Stenotrophomonas sp. JAI102]|nr:hypothetical protein [Stenotrophomonas sp. JAI102]